MTAIVAAVPHRERLSRAAKAAEQRRVLSEVRKHEFTRRPPHGEQAKERRSRRSRGCPPRRCLSLGQAKERSHARQGGKSISAIGVALAINGFCDSA